MKNQSGKENVSGFLYCLRSLLTLILHTHTFYYHTKPNGSSRKRSSIGIRIFEANTELPDIKLTDSISIATSKSEINIYFVFSWILRCSLDMSSHTTHTCPHQILRPAVICLVLSPDETVHNSLVATTLFVRVPMWRRPTIFYVGFKRIQIGKYWKLYLFIYLFML